MKAGHWVKVGCLVAWLAVGPQAWANGPWLVPGNDQAVVEVLPKATRWRPAPTAEFALAPAPAALPLAQAMDLARADIASARETGDPRHWGRARAVLAPWWDKPGAPVQARVLQATVLQGQHAFGAAEAVLAQVVQQDPRQAQAWLTLATLHKLAGRYPLAMQACERLLALGHPWHGNTCLAEARSLAGQPVDAAAWRQLARSAPDASSAAWLRSLWGEHLERAGQDRLAADQYRQSLALASDTYTALASADLWLRLGQPQRAGDVLRNHPDTDGVLLRRARALRDLKQPAWRDLADTLAARAQASAERGDDTSLHAREQALRAWWLQDDPVRAAEWARTNLALQKEPIDWWLALATHRLAGQRAPSERLRAEALRHGPADQRLTRELTHAPV